MALPDLPRTPRALVGSGFSIALVGAALAGFVLLFVSRGALWLDEAQSVSIARLPLGDLFRALREDGAPPLYYLALHGWMAVFGEGTASVRALSGVFGLASIPLMWMLADRLGGRTAAVAATILLATSPFAIRYGSEARMYSLVILIVLVGGLCIERALREPTTARLVAVSVTSGLLLLTHYWALHLVASVVLMLLLVMRHRPSARRVAVAVGLGGVAFVPWLPTFLHQLRTTGAPWAGSTSPRHVIDALQSYGASNGLGRAGWTVFILLMALVAVAIVGRGNGPDAEGRGVGMALAFVVTATLTFALIAGLVGDSPLTGRYSAVVFPVVVLLAAIGVTRLPMPAAAVVLLLAAAGGLMGGRESALAERTAAPIVAAELGRLASADDVVVYCPDQLGPSTSRLVDPDLRQVTFPGFSTPERIDWEDYLERIESTDVERFATDLDDATTGDVWMVTAPDYLVTSDTCGGLQRALEDVRGTSEQIVAPDAWYFEQAGLVRLPPD